MSTKEKSTHLRPGYSAAVRTTEEVVVATLVGNVKQQAIEHVRAGGALPSNLAPGEYERLDKLGAFDPIPTRGQRGLIEATPQHVLNATAPVGRAVATPSEVVVPTEEQAAAQEALAEAEADVRAAFDETQASDAVPVDVVETVPSVPIEASGGAVSSKADLLSLAQSLDLDVNARSTKADIQAALDAHAQR